MKQTQSADLSGAIWAPIPAPTITRAQRKLIDAHADITQRPGTADDASYMAAALVQCTLPHNDPGDVSQWVRRSAHVTLGMQAGRDFDRDVSLGYPYGSLPRLILFWITNEAVRTEQRRLNLRETFSQFIHELGLELDTRGRRRLRDQMIRLFSCSIWFTETQTADDKTGRRWQEFQVAPAGELWWNTKRPEDIALFESWIELGEHFFRAIIKRPVPVDLRALRVLRQSPLALDVYAWATLTTFIATKTGEPQLAPWAALSRQFGADYRDPDNFKKKMLQTLQKVRYVYPALRVERVARGVRVLPSRTAISAQS